MPVEKEVLPLVLMHPWIGACAVLVCAMLWIQYRVKLARSNALAWLGLIVAGLFHGALQPFSSDVRMLSPVGTSAFAWAVMNYLMDLFGVRVRWTPHILITFMGIPGSILVFRLTGSPNWGALVPALCTISGPVWLLYRITFRPKAERRFTPIQIGFLCALVFHLFVGLAFPYAFTRPELNNIGYTLSAFFLVLECMFMQSSMVEAVARDQALLSERLKFQESALQAAKAAALGQMAGGVAHEINNPLAILSMRVQRLLGFNAEKRPVDGAALDEELQKMLKTIERVSHIVGALQSLTVDGRTSKAEVLKISEAVDSVLLMARKSLEEKNVRIKLLPSTLEGVVTCPRPDFTQIVYNLLQNARDASVQAGTDEIRISSVVRDGSIRLTIEDDGQGVQPEMTEKIFDPFFSTKPVGQGIGNGLAIARALAAGINGKVEIESLSKPTRFALIIPQSRHSVSAAFPSA